MVPRTYPIGQTGSTPPVYLGTQSIYPARSGPVIGKGLSGANDDRNSGVLPYRTFMLPLPNCKSEAIAGT